MLIQTVTFINATDVFLRSRDKSQTVTCVGRKWQRRNGNRLIQRSTYPAKSGTIRKKSTARNGGQKRINSCARRRIVRGTYVDQTVAEANVASKPA